MALFSAEQNHFSNAGRGYYEEYSVKFCSAEWNHLCNFGRGYHEEQF